MLLLLLLHFIFFFISLFSFAFEYEVNIHSVYPLFFRSFLSSFFSAVLLSIIFCRKFRGSSMVCIKIIMLLFDSIYVLPCMCMLMCECMYMLWVCENKVLQWNQVIIMSMKMSKSIECCILYKSSQQEHSYNST